MEQCVWPSGVQCNQRVGFVLPFSLGNEIRVFWESNYIRLLLPNSIFTEKV